MKQFVFAIAAVMLLTISACKKDAKTVTCKLLSRATNIDSSVITYDAQGRVLTYENIGESVYTFTYTSALAAQCVVSIPGNPTYDTYNVFLNSNGAISSMNNSRVIAGSTYDYSYAFKYDADGRIIRCDQMVEQIGGSSNSIKYDSMVYENGSLVKHFTFYANTPGGPYTLQEYAVTSNTDKPNKMGYHAFSFVEEPTSILSGFYPFFHLYGKSSEMLPAETTVYTNTGALSFIMSYTYLFDENGYVTEENVTRSIIAPSTTNRRFYYSCE